MSPCLPLLVFTSLLLGACGEKTASSSPDPDGGQPPTGEPESAWFPLESEVYPSALASDGDAVYLGAGGQVLAIDHESAQAQVRFEVKGADDGAEIRNIFAAEAHLIVVTELTDYDLDVNPPVITSEKKLWLVPKDGSQATALDASSDVRSYLGATIHDGSLYYSSFTALIKRPLGSGSSSFFAESPGPVSYWIFTPMVRNESIYWAEGSHVYKMALSDSSRKGAPVAEFPALEYNRLKLHADTEERLVVSFATVAGTSAASFDVASETVGAEVALGEDVEELSATTSSYWTAGFGGVHRVDRQTGESHQLSAEPSFHITSTGDTTYFIVEGAILRVRE